MKAALADSLRLLVSHEDEIQVNMLQGDLTLAFTIACHPADRSRIIGKSGSTLAALRLIFSKMAVRCGAWPRLTIELP